jgi:hypothetical protein
MDAPVAHQSSYDGDTGHPPLFNGRALAELPDMDGLTQTQAAEVITLLERSACEGARRLGASSPKMSIDM